MYRKLMFVMSFVVVLGLFSSASAADLSWDGGVSSEWEDPFNWIGSNPPPKPGDWVVINTQAGPGAIYDPMITSVSGPLFDGDVEITGLKIGIGDGKSGNLTVSSGGSLTAKGDFARIHIAVDEGSKGTMTIRDGATVTTDEFFIGKGGDGVLNMSGGYLHCTQYWFGLPGGEIQTGRGHINLDGGLIEAGYLWMNSGDPQQDTGTISVTKGVMMIHWDVSGLFKQEVERGLITGYNAEATNFDYDEALNNIAWKWDEVAGTTTMWAIPEPATVLLLGLGGLALIRKKR